MQKCTGLNRHHAHPNQKASYEALSLNPPDGQASDGLSRVLQAGALLLFSLRPAEAWPSGGFRDTASFEAF